jgi:CubicO group peptidase (beta-lactamase class C family)
MSGLQEIIGAMVARGDLPFTVAMVADGSGVHAAAAGGVAPDSLFRIFSMTKAVAAVAAAILAERGALDLDAPVTDYLPAFADVAVLDGWDGETPRLRPPARPVTVRELATHTAGFAYSHWNAEMRRYRAATGLPAQGSGLRAALFYPLAADPGAAWHYGIGPDWLGLVLAAAAGRSVEDVCTLEIFAPLGMADTVFDLDPAREARLVPAFARTPDGGFAPLAIAPPERPEVRGMGDALYGTPADYLRFLRMLLGGGALDGTRVLSAASVTALLASQTGSLPIRRMRSTTARISADVAFFPDIPKSHSLACLRVEADVPGMRHAGAQGWAGILNTHYWIDPVAGIAAVFMTQVLPFMDPAVAAAYAAFERAVYAGAR